MLNGHTKQIVHDLFLPYTTTTQLYATWDNNQKDTIC